MTAYFDTNALVKLYYPEPESDELSRWTEHHRPLWTPLHYSEMANTMSLKAFRAEIDTETLAHWRAIIEEDIVSGTLYAVQPDWSLVFQLAREISFEQTVTSGTRAVFPLLLYHEDERWTVDDVANLTGLLYDDVANLAKER